jgi:hypothetical protein
LKDRSVFIYFLVLFMLSAGILLFFSADNDSATTTPTTTTQETTTTLSFSTTSTTTTAPEPIIGDLEPPKVLITNCPTEVINEDIYELEWTAEAGSGDIVYIGILVEKDDANFTKVFFTKEDNSDLNTFPTAYTSNSYSYQIDNTNSNVAASFNIEINIISEQPNGDQLSAYDLCFTDYSPPTTTTSTTTSTSTTTTSTTTTTTVVEIYNGPFKSYDGFEGENQFLLESLVQSIPEALYKLLNGKVKYVNGCHQNAKIDIGRCPYGVWDSTGTYPDGSTGSDWAMSIWISNRAFESGDSYDVLLHEASHAMSFITRDCNTPSRTSYRAEAQDYFGGEEKFADALVLYFGGSYNHYRDSGDLSNEETQYIKEYLEVCTNS